MIIYDSFWDSPFEYETPPLPKDKAGISDYYRAQKNYNDLAYDDAAVRETLMNRIAARDMTMRSRGITPEGDINTDEGLSAIDAQIERINAESFKEEQIPRNSDLWESILKDYSRYSSELYDVREPSSFSRIIGTGAANLESYYKTTNAWKLFSSFSVIAGTEVLYGRIAGSAFSRMAGSVGGAFAINEFLQVPGNKPRARVALGLERESDFEKISEDARLNLLGLGLEFYYLPRFFRQEKGGPQTAGGGSGQSGPVIDATPMITGEGPDIGKTPRSEPPSRGPEERATDYAVSLQKPYRPEITGTIEKDAGKASSRLKDETRNSWNFREKKANILETFYKDRADGAIEYFGGVTGSGGDSGANVSGRELKSVEDFRSLIESGGNTAGRIGKFTSEFGGKGEFLAWAFDSKAPVSVKVLEHLSRYRSGEYVAHGEGGKEAALVYRKLLSEFKENSAQIVKNKEDKKKALEKYKKETGRAKESLSRLEKRLDNLRKSRPEVLEKARTKAGKEFDPQSGQNKGVYVKAAVNEARKTLDEKQSRLEAEIKSKKEGYSDLEIKAVEEKAKELDSKKAALEKSLKELDESVVNKGEGYVRNVPEAKEEIRNEFASFVHEMEVQNTIKRIVDKSVSPSEMNKNVIDYLDSVDFLTRDKLKEIRTITDPVMESVFSKLPYGIKDENIIINFHKELKGENTGDWVAVKLKNAFRAVDAKFEVEFAKYGISYKKLKDYDPNNWDKNAVSLTDKDEFVRDMLANVDYAQTRERARLRTDTTMESFSENVYESLVASVRTPLSSQKGLSISKKMKARRIIVWKDGESRYYMMSKYGRTVDPFEVIRHSAFSAANNLAKLEILGDNPSSGLEYLKRSVLDKYSRDDSKSSYGANRLAKNIDDMYSLMFDRIQFVKDPPVSMKAAKTVFSVGRVLKLHGSALTSAFLDPVTIAMHASTSTRNPFRNLFTYLNEIVFPTMTKEEGRTLGILAEETMRYSEELFTSSLDYYGAKYVEMFEKFNFTDKMTSINKFAVNNIMIRELGGHSGKKWSELPNVLREDLTDIGITPREWEEVRHLAREYKGEKILNPRLAADSAVNSAQHRAARKLQTYLSVIETASVPSFRTSGDLGILGNPTRGYRTAAAEGKTIKYTAYRSMAMFTNITNASAKSFTDYILKENKAPFHIFAMIAVTAFFTLLLGWAKEIQKGKKPTNPFAGDKNAYKFIFNSFIRAGFMNTNQEYVFSALYPLFTGGRPEGKLQSDAFEAVGKISHYVIKYGKADSDAKRRAVANDLLYYVNPLGSGPFSELYSRVVTDNMIKVFDPDAHEYFRKKNQRFLDEGGVFYWAPGGPPFKELAKE